MSAKQIIWQAMPKIDEGHIEIPEIPAEMLEDDSIKQFEPEEFGLGKDYYKGVVTNLGIFPINENFQPLDFWMGHTNFRITNSVRHIIKNVEGVEFFLALTPYRFKIAFGKSWTGTNTDRMVRQNINEAIKHFFSLLRNYE